MDAKSPGGTPQDIFASKEFDTRRTFERKRRRLKRRVEVNTALYLPLWYLRCICFDLLHKDILRASLTFLV